MNRMSDDLISRKSLIENLNKFAPEHYNALVNDLIAKEPTAFDKEKVHSELIELRNSEVFKLDFKNKYDEARSQGRYSAFLDAIRIVDKGGIE